ncbi:MAG: DEAD/DEAH box helicase [Acidobacteriota bacterium]|nr:DEAD/DEAH box helicase [Acidobacteriota bacterium]
MDPLALFDPVVRRWFAATFGAPTAVQRAAWPTIATGASTLVVAPTGSGKTLAAFLWCLNRLMFGPAPETPGCRVLYVSPLKALAVDVERNLQRPLAGLSAAAAAAGAACVVPAVTVRSGDTPAADRARYRRRPSDILITTPESLYLLLTSAARDTLRTVDTVIVDEIHALVPVKRGAHLALSLERLEARCTQPLQRIGLSATQRPVEEVARFLGGRADAAVRPSRRRARASSAAVATADANPADALRREFAESGEPVRIGYRPVTVIDTGRTRPLRLKVEMPVQPAAGRPAAGTPGSSDAARPSMWAAIHPRLIELIRGHRSTLIFVNSRRLAERLAGALNELAGETLVRSHHGSLAREQRLDVEARLKAGTLRALVATSSLELGIDMGAIDLVVQIEAPPSVASGLQRIGRSGHREGAVSDGVIVPKYRGDLVACAAVTAAMHEGAIEASHYPRNPLDVLAQQIVAMVAMDDWRVDELFVTVRRAAPFVRLGRRAFEGVLDMLSGRYASDAFAALRPRLTWHRGRGLVTARQGAKRLAVVNAGAIPDRGLYGVFLAGADRATARVGELDEEMVFESRVGDVFLLGASSWRIEQITHDRVLVSPAPGEPGRMPFWHGDRPGRPFEVGAAIGRLVRELDGVPPPVARERLVSRHDLQPDAADALLQYLREQRLATGVVPDDQTIVIERCRDDVGDWRVCVLSPFGSRIHTPWVMAAEARIRDATGLDVETMWGDDGFVVRFPDADEPPDAALMLPPAGAVTAIVTDVVGGSSLFAAHFREVAARCLLLPRHRPGQRTPLWQQRKRAADLLAVAAGFRTFPAVLETYRECLHDVFDLPALTDLLRRIERKTLRVAVVDAEKPSPFAASLLFNYVANYIYDGDTPLAERRAQTLSVDQAQLRELLGDAELRDLIDPDALQQLEAGLQHLSAERRFPHADALHDLLLRLGDLSRAEIAARAAAPEAAGAIEPLLADQRAIEVVVAGETRCIAVEDAARYRDAVGCRLPRGLPAALLEPVADPIGDLVARYARTHGPFTTADLAGRFGFAPADAAAQLSRLAERGHLLEGQFRPGRSGAEWCDADVLDRLRARSRARLRHEVAPVPPAALQRLTVAWHGLVVPRTMSAEGLLEVVEALQGLALPASIVEREILAARFDDYDPAVLDHLAASGAIVWVGVSPIGERDGRLALYLADRVASLLPPAPPAASLTGREAAIVEYLRERGASFFAPLHQAAGGGYPGETVAALWNLVWQGLVTNDSFHALRSWTQTKRPARSRSRTTPVPASRVGPPASEGRWSLVDSLRDAKRTPTTWTAALAQQLLARHGVLTREAIAAEGIPGGFTSVYDTLKAMEERGRVHRGYFVAGLGGLQFAQPAALDLLRARREEPEEPEIVCLAATDPANLYGSVITWPRLASGDAPDAAVGRGPIRNVGALVIIVDGAFAGYVARADRAIWIDLPDDEPRRTRVGRAVADQLMQIARGPSLEDEDAPRGMLIGEINGVPASDHPVAPFLEGAGFIKGAMGFQPRFARRQP